MGLMYRICSAEGGSSVVPRQPYVHQSMNGGAMLLQGVRSGYPHVFWARLTMKMSWVSWIFWPITHPLKTIFMPGGITGRGFPKGEKKETPDENEKPPGNGSESGPKHE